MVAIAATTNATPSLQASLSKVRLQQARREADQAESVAQKLRSEAQTAETEAAQSRSLVRTLSANSTNADPTYQARQSPASSGLRADSQNLLVDLYQRSAALRGTDNNPLLTANTPVPIQNAQGQMTGRIINVRA